MPKFRSPTIRGHRHGARVRSFGTAVLGVLGSIIIGWSGILRPYQGIRAKLIEGWNDGYRLSFLDIGTPHHADRDICGDGQQRCAAMSLTYRSYIVEGSRCL